MDSLSRLAIILILLIIFFALLTQRIMITSEDDEVNSINLPENNRNFSQAPAKTVLRSTLTDHSHVMTEHIEGQSQPNNNETMSLSSLNQSKQSLFSNFLSFQSSKLLDFSGPTTGIDENEMNPSEMTGRRRRRRRRPVDDLESFAKNSSWRLTNTADDLEQRRANRKRLKQKLEQQLLDLQREDVEDELRLKSLTASKLMANVVGNAASLRWNYSDGDLYDSNRTVVSHAYAATNSYEYHPPYSPRPGTDISESQQLAVLKCHNQSRCIVPELQLKIVLRVYLCKHPTKQGVRFYFLAREGFLLHPNVILVDESEMDTADFIVYLPGSSPWHLTECTNMTHMKKLIVLDEFDGFTLFHPRSTIEEMKAVYGPKMVWYFMYFKRSFVARIDGKFLRYPHLETPDVYPMTYALAEAYLPNVFNFKREIEILCTLRGSSKMITRQRVQDWVTEYATNRSVANVITSQVTADSRMSVSKVYFQRMYNTKIIVTVNPANWEGDFRLWEAFATGALIMVDPIFVPHGFPIVDGVHVVFFSNQNKGELFEKLDYYRANPLEARKIAVAGYLHTMKYHRTVSLADYVLRSAHLKRATIKGTKPMPRYQFSAQYLNAEAARQKDSIKSLDRPGNYSASIIMLNHTHMEL